MSDGSIPAPAGETSDSLSNRRRCWVHPRACGGNGARDSQNFAVHGPSPRLRGKRPPDADGHADRRSIPAPAGETSRGASGATERWVHPRACGGNAMSNGDRFPANGPSPRLRGKLLKGAKTPAAKRSIPAPAGETTARDGDRGAPTVHPRACGGNSVPTGARDSQDGPSPRLRGKPLRVDRGRDRDRSIPAPAGETARTGRPLPARRVHPRACGGNHEYRKTDCLPAGPSPRLRGKPPGGDRDPRGRRSIPAPAGET